MTNEEVLSKLPWERWNSQPWLKDRTILLTKHGSHAYGLNRPTSDIDVKGIAVPPREYFHGFLKKFAQAEANTPIDCVLFDLRKFCGLAADCNPNIIEILFTSERHWILTTPAHQRLVEKRDLFLSKKARYTFSGYAHAQLKRIEGHYKWIKAPPKAAPERKDYGLPEHTSLMPKEQRDVLESLIRKQIEEWDIDWEPLDEATRIALRAKLTQNLTEMKIASDDSLWSAAGRHIGISDNMMEILAAERRYKAALNTWHQYLNWKATRNPARHALEEKWGYDCYLDDTEFLTASGWKRFDAILADEAVATVNPHTLQMEFQVPTERYESPYSGPIWHFEAQGTACAVTPHHKMFVSPQRRSPENDFSTAYDASRADWALIPGEILAEGRRSHFHVRVAAEPADKNYPVTDDYLILMGTYVSEGCVGKRREDGSVRTVRLSQKIGGRLEPFLERVRSSTRGTRHVYEHKDAWREVPIKEAVYLVNDPWASAVVKDCGEYSEHKRLPAWVVGLSARQARLLLDVLVAGDGTERKHSRVYYTSSKGLADDIQALAVSAGVHCQVWGPYLYDEDDTPMWQVYLRDRATLAMVMRHGEGIREEQVEGRKIVCFTVPNSVLVTRRNGKVAIHGNTKHAMHLVRLMRMAKEILTTGKVIVERPDRDELLAIRDGAWTYDQLLVWAYEQDAQMDVLYKESRLPREPDRNGIDALCVSVVEAML